MSGGVVGAKGMVMKFSINRHPEINIQRSNNAFAVTFIALSLEYFEARLLNLLAKSLIETSGTLGAKLLSYRNDIVKAESSGKDPRATWNLVSNLPHPRINKTKQHTHNAQSNFEIYTGKTAIYKFQKSPQWLTWTHCLTNVFIWCLNSNHRSLLELTNIWRRESSY